MKWIVLPYSESYFEETKYMLVKFYQFSCYQEYYKTNSIRKRVWIVYNFSAFVISQRSCRNSLLCAHFLSIYSKLDESSRGIWAETAGKNCNRVRYYCASMLKLRNNIIIWMFYHREIITGKHCDEMDARARRIQLVFITCEKNTYFSV